MTCLVHIEFRANPARIDDLFLWLRQILPDTRGREGCVSVAVVRNQDDPAEFSFSEQCDSRQHYERYFAWREQQGALRALAAFVEGEASFRFFDYVGL